MLDQDLTEGRDASDDAPDNAFDDMDDETIDRSLADDVSALIDDGKNYIEAEVAFQKTRLSFVADRSKSGVILILAALAFLHLALIGLVVGGIFSLAPLIGPFFATLAVVGTLLLGMVIFLLMAKGKFTSLSSAFKDDSDGQ